MVIVLILTRKLVEWKRRKKKALWWLQYVQDFNRDAAYVDMVQLVSLFTCVLLLT